MTAFPRRESYALVEQQVPYLHHLVSNAHLFRVFCRTINNRIVCLFDEPQTSQLRQQVIQEASNPSVGVRPDEGKIRLSVQPWPGIS